MKPAFLFFFFCAIALPAQNRAAEFAGVIFLHGDIYTGTEKVSAEA
jgi:hypothetical protein